MTMQLRKSVAEEQLAQHFRAVRGELPGADWTDELRRTAFEAFERSGLPHRRLEPWKYTDLRNLQAQAFPPSHTKNESVTLEQLEAVLGPLAALDCCRIVFVDGLCRQDLSQLVELADVEALTLRAAMKRSGDQLRNILAVTAPPECAACVQLNTAFMTDGASVVVPDGLRAVRPLHLVFLSSGQTEKAISTRNVISIGKESELTILESHLSLGDAPVQSNSVTQLVAGEGAKVVHLRLQDENMAGQHLATWLVELGAKADYRSCQLTLGGAVTRNTILLDFTGEHAKANIAGAYLLSGRQHVDTTMVVNHGVPNCDSKELFKLVLDDESRGIFQGKLIVRPDAQKTDGKQMAQALLLSERAEFDSKPELEIYADDVACGHGSTSGQIDEDMLFYLMARGIERDQARHLLVRAFVQEALEGLEIEAVADALMAIVDRRLTI